MYLTMNYLLLFTIGLFSFLLSFPTALFVMPIGVYFVTTLNNNFIDKVNGLLVLLFFGYPFYFILSFLTIFDYLCYIVYKYL